MARRRRGRRQRRGAEAADGRQCQDAVVAADGPQSSLPDDLLRRILFFAPAKEAASTCVLSRRWRTLWRTSGAVNLDTRSYSRHLAHYHDAGRRVFRRFVRGAQASLAAAHAGAAAGGGPVTRLTVHAEAAIAPFLNRRRFRALFSHPAARRVEELHATVTPSTDLLGRDRGGLYKLSFRKLPSEALRVLHVTNFTHLKPPRARSGAAFSRLTELRLKGCTVSFSRLQRVVDASPQLATLHLESTSFPGVDNVAEARRTDSNFQYHGGYQVNNDSKPAIIGEPCYRLVFPTITTLVFANYTSGMPDLEGGLEIEAPRLRYFRYHGILLVKNQALLKVMGASNVIGADLHLIVNTHSEHHVHIPFWQFIHDFSNAKVLRLKMNFAIEHIAIVDNKGQQGDLLCNKFFPNLDRLELEGYYELGSRTAAVTIANFLHCCPVVRDLHLKLKIWSLGPLKLHSVVTQAQLDFNNSIDRFKRRRRAMNLLDGDDDCNNNEVSDIPALSKNSFDCLQTSLRIVSLQLWMEKPNCFGVQLAKFFTNKAVLLEEMQIDDGNQMMHEHLNSKVGRWAAKRRNPLSVTSFGESFIPSN